MVKALVLLLLLLALSLEQATELVLNGDIDVGDQEVHGIGPIEPVIDADEHPTSLLQHHDVDAVLVGFPLRPLQTVGIAAISSNGCCGICRTNFYQILKFLGTRVKLRR